VYAYNPTENTWTQFTDLPAKRFSIVAGGIDGKLYASGGNNSRTTYMAALPETFLSTEITQNTLENGENSIKIYPNPAKNSLFISKIGQNIEIINFSIYDINGRMLQNFSAESVKNGSGYQIPVAQFSAGLYLLRIKNANGNTVNKRLLIQ
ncbi:MAG TPA: T9SS type A sorting domain-containing protein, partial [Leeuwenhoekiella sp.]|nr:T9SS type A sorting domain-containing protein [Leeuwenhoekiella sp.]